MDTTPEVEEKKERCLPYRYLLTILGAVGLLPVVGSRKTFALLLTHVTSLSEEQDSEGVIFSNCSKFNTSRDIHVDMEGDTMFLVHAVYFAGTTIFMVPATALATWISPVRIVGVSVMIFAVAFLVLPSAVPVSTPLVFFLRIVQGAGEGVQQPASIGVLSAWCTEDDKTRLFSIYFTGAYIAPALAAVMTSFTLCYVDWSSSLYVWGAFGVLWSCAWLYIGYDSPDAHANLPKAERDLHNKHGTKVQTGSKRLLKSIPWRRILTSPPVWAVFVGSFSRCFIYSILVTEQPQYFLDSFQINIADIGILSTLPHIGLSVFCVLGGVISDKLVRSSLPTTFVRKLLFTTGNGIEGLCLVALYFTRNWKTGVTLMSSGVAAGGLGMAGYGPLPADLAPQYAGVIAGLTMMGGTGAVVSNILASMLTGKSKSLADWQTLFLVSGLIHIVGVLIFDVIADANIQPWAQTSGGETPGEKVPLIPEISDKTSKLVAEQDGRHFSENGAVERSKLGSSRI